jgi:alcohol dehydrogenase class IV
VDVFVVTVSSLRFLRCGFFVTVSSLQFLTYALTLRPPFPILFSRIHAIEAFTCATKKNQLSDVLAKEALRVLGANIREAVFEGSNVEARGQMLYGSMLSGMSFANSPVAAVHALAYPLGSIFKVPHGLSCSLMLPPVMEFNSEVCYELYAELGDCVFPDEAVAGGSKAAKSDRFVANMKALIEDLELPTKLGSCGVKEADVGTLVEESMKQVRLLPNNPREVGREDAAKIYTSIM